MIIFTWRTSSSSAQIGERSQNVYKREVLHHFNIQISGQLCFTCLKGQQRFSLLNKIKRIIYSSQLASLPHSFENQRQGSTFEFHELSSYWRSFKHISVANGFPWRKSKEESFIAHYKLIIHAPLLLKLKNILEIILRTIW
jgi:hypothetical protein